MSDFSIKISNTGIEIQIKLELAPANEFNLPPKAIPTRIQPNKSF